MSAPLTRLAVLRAAETSCLARGVDALALADVAASMGESRAAVSRLFHDETTLLDALLERHQTPYERGWEVQLETVDSPRATLRQLVSTIAAVVQDEDGGHAYVAVAAQMCSSARFPLTGRPATTTPVALKLMGKLIETTQVPFSLIPLRFERFASILFSSVLAWYRHGAARVPDEIFIEDLVDVLEAVALAAPSPSTLQALAR
jgi:AcrR family transcriptional regulator